MEVRKLTIEDIDKLEELIAITEDNIENKDFWLPINEESRKHFFDDDWAEFFGMFEEDCLVGAAALFYNEHEYGESVKQLDFDIQNVAEIGRAMVHPAWRGNNILYQINAKLLRVAKEKGIDYILATIHPQNVPSQCSFKKLGLKKVHTYIKWDKYVRDVFLGRVI